MEWMLMPLRRYADFDGRSRRQEYWMFVVFLILLSVAAGMLGLLLVLVGYGVGLHESDMAVIVVLPFALLGLASLGLIIPSLAVQVRRFHDQDKSGWMILLGLIPFVGGLIVLVFMCLEGTPGPNRYGPDPKAGEPAGQTFA